MCLYLHKVMQKRLQTGIAAIIVVSLFLPLLVWAQDSDFETTPQLPKPSEKEKKHPSIFHRPAKESPAEQLAYANTLQEKGRKRKATRQYGALVHKWGDSDEAVTAQKSYAGLFDERRRYEKAFEEYQYLIDHYSGNFPYNDILERQFKIANYIRTERKRFLFIFPKYSAPERALPLFEDIVRNAPHWEKTPEAQFCIGLIQEENEEYELAATAYEVLQNRWPESDFTDSARFRTACCLYHAASENPRDEQRCREALSALASFIRDYPDAQDAETIRTYIKEMSDQLAGLYYERALFYDKRGKKPDSALIAYSDFIKNCPSSDKVEKAKERVSELEQEIAQRDAKKQ